MSFCQKLPRARWSKTGSGSGPGGNGSGPGGSGSGWLSESFFEINIKITIATVKIDRTEKIK